MIRIRSVLLILAAACAGGTAAAQTKQTLTHEVLWSFHRVGAPVPSPDGKWVVFPVTEPSYDPAKDVTDLWIVPADGRAQPRRLTSNKAGEGGPAWSSDSTRLAFAAKRDDDEVTQIYALDVALGGDAQRLTNAPTAASAPKWSPDGTRVAFQAAMWRGATDEESNRKAAQDKRGAKSKVRVYEAFPIRNFDRWIDESKTHLWVVDVTGDRTARSLLAGTKLAALTGFGGEALGAAWAPDGQSLVFAATDESDVAARAAVASGLWQVPAGGGEATRLPAAGWDVGAAKFRPDGKAICFSGRDARAAIYTVPRLGCASWPWNPGGVTVMVKELDRPVGSWAFAPDSKTIYFTAEDAGHERVYAVPAAGGAATLVADAPQGVYTGLQVPERASSPVLFANWESAVNPPEIVRIDPATKTRGFLTSFNTAKAASIDWQPLRDFWFTGRGGRRIHSYVALPPNFDPSKKYPLFVLIHGGHASSWRDAISYRWNYHLLAHPGFVLLATDYRGSTGYGEQFTLDILGDPLKGPADDINDAADEAIKRFSFIDGTRQAAGGASYGGHLANWLEGHDVALQGDCQPRRPGVPRHAVGHERRDLPSRADDGRAVLGEPAEMDRAEPAREGRQLQDADAAVGRRERFPRARGEHAGDVLGAPADEGADQTARLARREPLDPQGREQPRVLSRGARVAGEVCNPAGD